MSADNIIKVMANDLRQAEVWDDSDGVLCRAKTAKNLYKMGWRKQSDVIRDFAESVKRMASGVKFKDTVEKKAFFEMLEDLARIKGGSHQVC